MGAPSAEKTRPGLAAHCISAFAEGWSPGGLAGPTGGRGTTTTDLGSRNEGGMLSRRFSVSLFGKARAGMYWKCAVCREPRMRAVSMMAPIYGLYAPAPPRCE